MAKRTAKRAPAFARFMESALKPVNMPPEVPEWKMGKLTEAEWRQMSPCVQTLIGDAVERVLAEMWRVIEANPPLPVYQVVDIARERLHLRRAH